MPWPFRATEARAIIDPPAIDDPAPRDLAGLANVVAYHAGFYSGGAPEGDDGFGTLVGLGVRTIISVDGAAPDVEAARALGIRYIHLPIGYDGFDHGRELELARATRDAMAEGPVYIHCHHGKHRSAGAAATIAVALGWGTPEEMVMRMKVSGTAAAYEGLYACAMAATRVDAAELDAVWPEFPEVSRPAGLVAGMVEIDEIMDHLEAIQAAGWRAPENHPDLVPAAEAGRLADLLRLMAQGERARTEPEGFAHLLDQASALAQAIEESLASGSTDSAARTNQLTVLATSCTDCHARYRD